MVTGSEDLVTVPLISPVQLVMVETSLCVIWRQSIQVTSFYALVIRSAGASFSTIKKGDFMVMPDNR